MKMIAAVVCCFSAQLFAGALSWQRQADLLVPVQEIYPAVFQGEIYVAGGLSSELPKEQGQMTAAVQIYNPTTNSWRYGTALPQGRHHGQLVAVGDELYLFGGFIQANGGAWSASRDVLRLDQVQQRWVKVADLPEPLSETVSFVLDGKIHLVSGRSPATQANAQWQDQGDVASHFIVDPVTLTIEQGTALPIAKNSAGGVAAASFGYIVGGRKVKAGNEAGFHRYDGKTKEWQRLSGLPEAQAGLAVAALRQELFVFGGEFFHQGGGVFSKVWGYSLQQQSWQSQGEMPQPRHGLGAVTLDNAIYLIGGATAAGLKQTSAVVEKVQLQ